MKALEQELRRALARKEPSPDFAGRVTRAAQQLEDARRPKLTGWPRWAAAAAALILLAGSGISYRIHQGETARQRVLLAVRIAGGKLHHIQTRVREVRP